MKLICTLALNDVLEQNTSQRNNINFMTHLHNILNTLFHCYLIKSLATTNVKPFKTNEKL